MKNSCCFDTFPLSVCACVSGTLVGFPVLQLDPVAEAILVVVSSPLIRPLPSPRLVTAAPRGGRSLNRNVFPCFSRAAVSSCLRKKHPKANPVGPFERARTDQPPTRTTTGFHPIFTLQTLNKDNQKIMTAVHFFCHNLFELWPRWIFFYSLHKRDEHTRRGGR